MMKLIEMGLLICRQLQ